MSELRAKHAQQQQVIRKVRNSFPQDHNLHLFNEYCLWPKKVFIECLWLILVSYILDAQIEVKNEMKLSEVLHIFNKKFLTS